MVFRATLPVHPYKKTESDNPTIEIVRHFTNIPVPFVYAFDSSMQNPLGLEWILMDKVNGKPLRETWFDMEYDSQLCITELAAS